MLITDADGNMKQITPMTITIEGEQYHFIMNTREKEAYTLQKAVGLNGIRTILVRNASDMMGNPLPDDLSAYISQTDHDGRPCADLMVNTYHKIIHAFKDEMVKRGVFSPDAPINKVYLGCEKDPEFRQYMLKAFPGPKTDASDSGSTGKFD